MTVDDVIAALSALTAEQRALPLVIAPPEYVLPAEATAIRYMPADALLAVGSVVLMTTQEPACSPPPETCSTSADA